MDGEDEDELMEGDNSLPSKDAGTQGDFSALLAATTEAKVPAPASPDSDPDL